jgi:hypothetical protein
VRARVLERSECFGWYNNVLGLAFGGLRGLRRWVRVMRLGAEIRASGRAPSRPSDARPHRHALQVEPHPASNARPMMMRYTTRVEHRLAHAYHPPPPAPFIAAQTAPSRVTRPRDAIRH